MTEHTISELVFRNHQHDMLRARYLGAFLGLAEAAKEGIASPEKLHSRTQEVAEDYNMAMEYLDSHGVMTSYEAAIEYAEQARKDATNGQ